MSEQKYKIQDFEPVEADHLVEKVADLKSQGYRLGQVCCTKVEDGFEILYSFDLDHVLKNLRLTIPEGQEIMSITGSYWPAFIYENEIHDLFGVTIKHNALDYNGTFYKISKETPWNPKD